MHLIINNYSQYCADYIYPPKKRGVPPVVGTENVLTELEFLFVSAVHSLDKL